MTIISTLLYLSDVQIRYLAAHFKFEHDWPLRHINNGGCPRILFENRLVLGKVFLCQMEKHSDNFLSWEDAKHFIVEDWICTF